MCCLALHGADETSSVYYNCKSPYSHTIMMVFFFLRPFWQNYSQSCIGQKCFKSSQTQGYIIVRSPPTLSRIPAIGHLIMKHCPLEFFLANTLVETVTFRLVSRAGWGHVCRQCAKVGHCIIAIFFFKIILYDFLFVYFWQCQ